MYKKTLFSLIAVFVLAMMTIGTAFAAEPARPAAPRSFLGVHVIVGKVSDVGVDQFTILKADGGAYTYLVDENTRFRFGEAESVGLSDLLPGQRVIVVGRLTEDGLIARRVGILPEDFNPATWFSVRLRGEVLDVNLDTNTITVLKPAGEAVDILVDDHTRYFGQVAGFDDLEIGWEIAITGHEQKDGSTLAKAVGGMEFRRHVRNSGLVTAIDQEAGLVTIMTRKGEEAAFSIDDETKFHSKDNQVESLSDLAVDMAVVIAARSVGDDAFLAIHLAVAYPEDLPNFEVKAAGILTIVETGSFTVETRRGEQLTFIVDERTKYRSRGGEVETIEDLEPGMLVISGGDLGEDGQAIARLVVAVQTPSH